MTHPTASLETVPETIPTPPERVVVGASPDDASSRRYTGGEYLAQNPTWHAEDSPWKAEQILRMLRKHQLAPKTVCEAGCGAGGILAALKQRLPKDCRFVGYDISPQAYALAAAREDERLRFHLGDATDDAETCFDVILVIDLLEHLEDYFRFLRRLRPRGLHKIFHIPLDLSAYSVLRRHPILDLRKSVGHIHYFTRDTALAALRDTGYEIIDAFYPPDDQPIRDKPRKRRILALLRKGLGRLDADLSARLLGGRSLMVLAR